MGTYRHCVGQSGLRHGADPQDDLFALGRQLYGPSSANPSSGLFIHGIQRDGFAVRIGEAESLQIEP